MNTDKVNIGMNTVNESKKIGVEIANLIRSHINSTKFADELSDQILSLVSNQIAQARADALREVHQWLLENQVGHMVDGDGCIHISIDGYEFEALKSGQKVKK